MTITIQLAPELEDRIREEASASGVDTESWVINALATRLLKPRSLPSTGRRLSAEESILMQEINRGLSESEWLRYRQLIEKRDDETLTPDEHAELIGLSDEIEVIHAERLESLSKLARVRGTTLESLMAELGIRGHRDV